MKRTDRRWPLTVERWGIGLSYDHFCALCAQRYQTKALGSALRPTQVLRVSVPTARGNQVESVVDVALCRECLTRLAADIQTTIGQWADHETARILDPTRQAAERTAFLQKYGVDPPPDAAPAPADTEHQGVASS